MRCKNDDAATFLVTIAGSAGSFAPLRQILGALSARTSAAIAVAIHVGPGSTLVDVLRPGCALPVEWARPSSVLRPGRVYVASPRTHLIVNPDATATVSSFARPGLFRPSANWLFESAAASFHDRHLALVLSGTMWDGAAQLGRVKRVGGSVWVQAPDDASYPDMPRAALATGWVDRELEAAMMPRLIASHLAGRDRDRDANVWRAPFRGGRAGLALRPPLRFRRETATA